MVQRASDFYSLAIVGCNSSIVSVLLGPFFLGPALFPFAEAVVPPFCDLFLSFTVKPYPALNFEAETDEFIRSVEFRSSLIPAQHRRLLHLLETHHGETIAISFLLRIFADFFRLFAKSRSNRKVAKRWYPALFARWTDDTVFQTSLWRACTDFDVSIFEVVPLRPFPPGDPSEVYLFAARDLPDLSSLAGEGLPDEQPEGVFLYESFRHVQGDCPFESNRRCSANRLRPHIITRSSGTCFWGKAHRTHIARMNLKKRLDRLPMDFGIWSSSSYRTNGVAF
jgi:hypothetical protein